MANDFFFPIFAIFNVIVNFREKFANLQLVEQRSLQIVAVVRILQTVVVVRILLSRVVVHNHQVVAVVVVAAVDIPNLVENLEHTVHSDSFFYVSLRLVHFKQQNKLPNRNSNQELNEREIVK